MIGAYHMPDRGKLQVVSDPRFQRLLATWPAWEFRTHPAGGSLLLPKGIDNSGIDLHAPVITCDDGLRWHPPATMPTLHDLARDEMPQPATRITLRRIGQVSVPLGVGPVYGAGRRKGQPSSELGRLAHDLYQRAIDKEREWTQREVDDTERVCFLALRAGYHLSEELFGELSPYDTDETELIVAAVWGSDPKASASDGPTSPPSPQGSSAIPG